VPIGISIKLLQGFAGKTTDIRFSAVVSVSVVVNLLMGGALRRKSQQVQEQKDEINRHIGRVEALEAGLASLGEDGGTP
jgi:hypothetical protein